MPTDAEVSALAQRIAQEINAIRGEIPSGGAGVTRLTRSQLDALVLATTVVPDQQYLITDEDRLAIGLTTATFQAFAKEGEGGSSGISITVTS